jgi:hypothetical protein
MATTLRQPIGANTEFEIVMRDPRRPEKERTFTAIFTWESIERIEDLASRHYGRITTIFDLIERPGIKNLAILLVEAINHDAVDTSWGGTDKKPDLKKMVKLLGADFAGHKFLELWRAICDCVRRNVRGDEEPVPGPSTKGLEAPSTTTTAAPQAVPNEAGSGDPLSGLSLLASTKPASGG